jgi:hypothetical protein
MLSKCSSKDEDALLMFSTFQASMTMEKALKAENQISYFLKNYPVKCEIAIQFLIETLSKSFAGNYKLSDVQIDQISSEIIKNYWFLRIEEIMYVFSKIKNGEYGDINYSGIDQARIMKALALYDTTERNTDFVDYHTANKAESLFFWKVDTDEKIAMADRCRDEGKDRNPITDQEIISMYTKRFKNTIGFKVAEGEITKLVVLYNEDPKGHSDRVSHIKLNKDLYEIKDDNHTSSNQKSSSLDGSDKNAKKRLSAMAFISELGLDLNSAELEELVALYLSDNAKFTIKLGILYQEKPQSDAQNNEDKQSETQSTSEDDSTTT